jgi:hypothetical protein
VPKRVLTADFYRRNRWEFVFFALAVTLIVSVAGQHINSSRISREAAQGAATHQAVCALRRDYGDRIAETRRDVAASVVFLRLHPHGVAGLATRADLRQHVGDLRRQLAGQLRTRRTLAALRC